MKKYAYFKGEIIPREKIVISYRDLGFLRGYGIMDAMKTVRGKLFLVREHFERLENGAEAMNLKLPFNLQEFGEITEELMLKNPGTKDVAIKTMVTGGESSNGLKIEGEPTVLITLNNLKGVSPAIELYEQGSRVVSANFQRSMPRIKTTNYIFVLQQQNLKEKAGANEVIYHHDGYILEGATSNIFIVKNGRVVTPLKNILLGTTRNFVIKIFKENNIEVEERDVKFEELLGADEVFLTGTFKDILPVVKVDDKIIGEGRVGFYTKKGIKILDRSSERLSMR